MLETLKFVQGSVARKDHVAALTHFNIRAGRIMGYNGKIAISSPIQLNLEASPRAEPFIRAIATCQEEAALSLTQTGRLAIASGTFKAFIECTTEPYPDIQPTGQVVQLSGRPLLEAFKRLLPFVSDDASRPWSMGILLRNKSAFATNNIVLAEQWLGYESPCEINIPRSTVEELLRINEEPIGLRVDTNSATFYYTGERWLRTVLYSTQWPDLYKILDTACAPLPIPQGFFAALENLHPFCGKNGAVYLSQEGISTSAVAGEGASVALPMQLKEPIVFNAEKLLLLSGVAQVLDVTLYPKPCLFYGDQIRGAIIGLRL